MPESARELQPDTATEAGHLYHAHVNPQWVRLLHLLGMDVQYTHCEGAELTTARGRRILDFLSGYCVYNTGHNHPRILKALHAELQHQGPTMLQSHIPELAGELAWRLTNLAGGALQKVFFTSSGSEGIETAIKFSRARTGRPGLLHAQGAFHGLTCGALSLMDNPWWREGFGPLLPGTVGIPFGDLDALEKELQSHRYAAFIVEPLQAEAGIRLPPPGYLASARDLCHRHGTLLVLDEVQTGLFRTGPFLVAHDEKVQPDMVVLAKALSGGLIPVGAVLMTDAIYSAVFSSVPRAFVHASTYGENSLAMCAGLASLSVLEDEQLGRRSREMGTLLQARLRDSLQGFEMVSGVRGRGLLCGIVFQPPTGLRLKALFHGFTRIHPGMFGQMLVSRLFNRKGILTQMCGHNFMVLKVAPPLVVNAQQIERFVSSVCEVMGEVHGGYSFWNQALAMVPRALKQSRGPVSLLAVHPS